MYSRLYSPRRKNYCARRACGHSGTVQLYDQSRKRLAGRGFDKPHVIHTNHAPPHYARHIEALGYAKAMDLVAYVCRPREAHILKRREHFAGLSGDPTIKNIEIHTLSLRSWRRDFPRLLANFNDAGSDNAWATP
jgi:hypothetical protein